MPLPQSSSTGSDTIARSKVSRKILFSANTSWYIFNFRRSLISALLKDGHEIVVAAPPDNYSARIVELGCQFIPVKMDNSGKSPINDLLLIWRLRRIFKLLRPDIIFPFTIKSNVYSCFAARSQSIPVVPNVSGLGTAFLSENWLNYVVRKLYYHSFRWPKTIFFQNRDDKATFLLHSLATETQAYLLPGSGVDLTAFSSRPLPEGRAVTFLLVARLLWDKGVGEFVEAARTIRRQYPETKFQLLGFLDVENRSAISRKTVEDWVQEGVIEYLGSTDDVRPCIAASSCVVLPSFYPEGTPRSLLEAAAMARPVITTDSAGCRDVVEDGSNGFLCERHNAKSLVQSIRKFLDLSQDDRERMGRLSRQKMEREYDETIVISAYRNIISELAKSEHN